MRKLIGRLVAIASAIVAVMAVMEQLNRPKELRTWHGEVNGIPYDFRKPSVEKLQRSWWNPEDPRVFTPRDFGVGWSINFYRLLQGGTGSERNLDEDLV